MDFVVVKEMGSVEEQVLTDNRENCSILCDEERRARNKRRREQRAQRGKIKVQRKPNDLNFPSYSIYL